jgi:hypothetical protein
VFNPSSRALGVATVLTLSAVVLAPSASAALLGSGGGNSGALPLPALSGLTDVTNVLGGSSGLLAPVTNLLGGGGLGNVLNGTTNLSHLTSPNLPGLGGLGGLGGLSGLGGADGASGELVNGVFEAVGGTTLACGAAVPQLLNAFGGGVAGSLCEYNPFTNGGLVGLVGSL